MNTQVLREKSPFASSDYAFEDEWQRRINIREHPSVTLIKKYPILPSEKEFSGYYYLSGESVRSIPFSEFPELDEFKVFGYGVPGEDMLFESPNFIPKSFYELKSRGFKRINDPRLKM
ncbi:hypothetical protein HZC35_03925 [Candidatus Saganbacteria bacterium]|nr:hypothetical protein [Candidatus Saganbacteria bacterium]